MIEMFRRFLEKLSVSKLAYDLRYWIFIGIGNDLIEFKSQREEYSHYTDLALSLGLDQHLVPAFVLDKLNEELKKPFYLRPTFYRLVKILFKKN